MTRSPPAALTIAGSDPCGGAGLQSDLRTFAVHGLFGLAVPTATTVQSARHGVSCTEALDADLVGRQLRAAFADRPVAAAKTGMLATAGVAGAVAAFWSELPGTALVVDPVLLSSSGAPLLDDPGLTALRTLLGVATVVTPNLAEAAALLGAGALRDEDVAAAAEALSELGPAAVVVTGGHGPDPARTRDVLFVRAGRRVVEIEGPRVPTAHDHGTGCVHSASLVAALALGRPIEAAARHARACVERALRDGAAGSVWLRATPSEPPRR